MALSKADGIRKGGNPGDEMRADTGEAGIPGAGRVEIVNKEDDVAQICELLGVSADKRTPRAGRTVHHQQRWKRARPLRLIDCQAYLFVLRDVREHYPIRRAGQGWGYRILPGTCTLACVHCANNSQGRLCHRLFVTPPSPTSRDSWAGPRRTLCGRRCDTPAAAAALLQEWAAEAQALSAHRARDRQIHESLRPLP